MDRLENLPGAGGIRGIDSFHGNARVRAGGAAQHRYLPAALPASGQMNSERQKGSDWYCPETDQIVHNPVRRYFFRRSVEGHPVVRFQDPNLSSDMAFLWGTYLGLMITAALLYGSGYLVIHGKYRLLAGAGYALLAIGFSVPLDWGVSMILLGRKCTKRKGDEPPATTPP